MQSSRDYFDEVSGKWDGRTEFFPDAVREVAFDALRVHPGGRAADLGAGTGFVTEGLLARGLSVIARRSVGGHARRVTAKIQSGSSRLPARRSRAAALPDCSVDFVLANRYLHHVESPALALVEAARILRPGGSLAISDLDVHDYALLQREHHDRWLGFEQAHMRGWLTEAGLEQARVTSIARTCQAASNAGDTQASIGIFLATGRKPRPQ